MGYWRNQGYNVLHYQLEQFENAVQEHRLVAYEQVEIAAALASSRTAAQMTSRVRDVENNVEANFRHNNEDYYPILLPSDSTQALKAQRDTLVQEATPEKIRRDADKAEALSQWNACIAPEVARLYKLEKLNYPPELQGQLLNLRQGNTRTNAHWDQIQITNNLMNTRNKELALQLQTSNI